MNGVPDLPSSTELEKFMGYPEHYTDVLRFSFSKRLHLIGKAWSVPQVQNILAPLQYFFKLKTKHEFLQ